MRYHRHDVSRVVINAISLAFQSPRPSSTLTAQALEGLFESLLHQLSHLQEVRTVLTVWLEAVPGRPTVRIRSGEDVGS